MNCASCGIVAPYNAAICPNCGASFPMPNSYPQAPDYAPQQPNNAPPATGYSYPQQGYAAPQQGYAAPGYNSAQAGYMGQQQSYAYGQPQYPPPYQQMTNVTVVNNAQTSNTPVIVEVLLNFFLGIYGVGWLMAGETTTGIVLLVCSFVVYWPVLIGLAVLTLGIGLFCDIPLVIGAVILNAVLLSGALKRRYAQVTVVQTRY